MKKIIFLTIAVLLTIALYGQEAKQHTYPGWYISLPSNDTVRTFYFYNMDLDSCKLRFVKTWGEPKRNTTGILMWDNIEIQNIGKELTIHLTDRLCTTRDDEVSCVAFKDEKDKEKKLKNSKPNQSRMLELIIKDKSNKDIIMAKEKVLIVFDLLEKILK